MFELNRLEQCTCNAEVVGSGPALARYFSNFPPYLILNRSHSLVKPTINILYILGRIVGGVDVEEGMIPWQVGLASSTLTRPFCGGSVIDKYTVKDMGCDRGNCDVFL
eukprot:sb/3477485/